MNEEPQQSILREYVAFVRRRWPVILGVAVLSACVGVGLAFTKPEQYAAHTLLRVHDPSQDFPAAGLPQGTAVFTPTAIAIQAEQMITSQPVLEDVRRRLGLEDSISSLRARISSSLDPTSNLVYVQAGAATPQDAVRLANATANAVARIANGAAQTTYATLARKLRHQIARLGNRLPDRSSSLTVAQQYLSRAIVHQQQQLGEQAARLAALSTLVQPVQVVEAATSSGSPISPAPERDGLVGGGIGLLLGLLAAVACESVDLRLRRPDTVETLLGAPILGGLREGLLGAVPFGEQRTEQQRAAMDVFRMVRNSVLLGAPSAVPRSILVTSPGPEEGKTTAAIGLAAAAAAAGLRTLLVEADVRRPVHARRLSLDATPGLLEVLHGRAEPLAALQVVPFIDPAVPTDVADPALQGPQSEFRCLPAGELGRHSPDVLGTSACADLIERLTAESDLVIIDSAPILPAPETISLLPVADAVLLCVRLHQTSSRQARAAGDAVARAAQRTLGVIVTDLSATSERYGYSGSGYGYRYSDAEPVGVAVKRS